jgi:UDP-glucuronate decarboxylase
MKLNDGRVFADFIRDVVTGQEITLKGDGKDRRSFCYLSDATTAFLHIFCADIRATPTTSAIPQAQFR